MPPLKIAPSILSADFSCLGQEIQAVVEAGADLIHVDVMDGHFTPNITIGPPVVASMRRHTPVPLDVHLMITEPELFVDDFAHAGADIISFHAEASLHPIRLLERIRDIGCKAGIVLNPATPHHAIDYLVDYADMVLVMTVNPGFGGQAFIPGMLRKIEYIRAMIGDKDLEVDGGVDRHTAPQVIKAGANVLVAGSSVYGSKDYLEAIESIRQGE